jgi:hypothetical protein
MILIDVLNSLISKGGVLCKPHIKLTFRDQPKWIDEILNQRVNENKPETLFDFVHNPRYEIHFDTANIDESKFRILITDRYDNNKPINVPHGYINSEEK